MKPKRRILVLLIMLMQVFSFATGRTAKGFRALAIYDYFKARSFFAKENCKNYDPYACYGMAIIHSRADNPFYSLDSAARYILLSRNLWHDAKDVVLSGINISRSSVLELADSIAIRKFRLIRKMDSVQVFDHFLSGYYFSSKKIIREAALLRDELEFNEVIRENSSRATTRFIVTHPLSQLYTEAIVLKDRQQFDEQTANGTTSSYIAFLSNHPKSAMKNTAFERLFSIYSTNKDLKGLAYFVKNYPGAPQNAEAWKLLFSLSVRSYSYTELRAFLAQYPDFPLKNSILKELELNKLVLYPYRQGELHGFIDAKGKAVIPVMYDAVSDFHDGLSLVNKNDSVFFINKENINPFNAIYSDAFAFRNGLAPVKTGSKWTFINRLGQVVRPWYDEVFEFSNGIYVVRSNGLFGTLDAYAQVILEPRFEKLGDFRNEYTYFIEDGRYGFVSSGGVVHKAGLEWISEFDEDHIALFRDNGKFGIINSNGRKLLDAVYDQVIKATGGIYIVVQENNYGFFNSRGCFVTPVAFKYEKESPEFYTNGTLFKLLKKNISIIDANGNTISGTSQFDDIWLDGEFLRVKKKNMFGFVNRKLEIIVPLKFTTAAPFKDSTAIVTSKGLNLIIDMKGKEIYSGTSPVERITPVFFNITNDKKIVNRRGEVLASGVEDVQVIREGIIVTLASGEIKLLYD